MPNNQLHDTQGGALAIVDKILTVTAVDDLTPITSILFDDFETSITVIDAPNLLWQQYPNGDLSDPSHEDNGTLSFNTNDKVSGTRSLQLDMDESPNGDPGAPYLQYHTHNPTTWQYIQDVVESERGDTWLNKTYNRLKFFIKAPASLVTPLDGTTNSAVGTYYSSVAAGGPTSSNAEVGGNHLYHYFNLKGGVWNQCFMDTHPTHIRGASGNVDQEDQLYPSPADADNYNYFDMLTRTYWDVVSSHVGTTTSTWLFDNYEFYKEVPIENEDQVYSVSGSYDSTLNDITLGWNRHKDDGAINHEVRYAFSNIHILGFDNASVPSSNVVSALGAGGYNQMAYSTTTIDVTGQQFIYMAIRPIGAILFKQVKLRLDL